MFVLRLLSVSTCLWCTLLPVTIWAEDTAPFHLLSQAAARQWGGWSGSRSTLSRLFQEERRRLGGQFEEELLEYVGTNIVKHYWCASYLMDATNDAEPDPKLALLILQQGISIGAARKEDQIARRYLVALYVKAAILCARMGLLYQAGTWKASVTGMVEKEPDLRGWWPACSSVDRKVFDEIPPMPRTDRVPTGEAGEEQ